MIKHSRLQLMSIAWAVLISALPSSFLLAQADSLHAIQLLNTAIDSANQQQYTVSNVVALQAAHEFEQLQDWEKALAAYHRIFMNGYYSNQYSFSIEKLEKGLLKIPVTESFVRSRIYSFLGYAYEQVGDNFSAIVAYEASVPLFKEIDDLQRLNAVYGNLGGRYMNLGDYSKAVDYLTTAVTSGQNLSDKTTLWKNLKMLGQAYIHRQEWKNAEAAFAKAQQLRDDQDGTFEYLRAKNLLGQDLYAKALRAIQQAIRLGTVAGEEVEGYQMLQGEIYQEAGQANKALAIFQSILPAYQRLSNQRELGKLYVWIGDTQVDLQQYEQALHTYQQALHTFLPRFTKEEPTTNPDLATVEREVWLMEIFKGKGDCFFEKYRLTKKERWLLLAEEHYQLAVDFIQMVKLNYDEVSSASLLSDHTHSFYEDLLKTKLEAFQLTNKPIHLEAAFQTAQQSSAFVLRELLSEQKALRIAGVAEDTLELLNNYQQQIILLNRKLSAAQVTAWDSLQTLFFDLKQQQLQLKKDIEEKHPSFTRLRNDLQVATPQQLQQHLDSSALLIKYFMGQQTLYAFSISRNHFKVDPISLPKNFAQLVNQYRRALSDLDFVKKSPKLAEQQFLQSAHQLYQLLLAPVLQQHSPSIRRLIVAGDGVLNSIPFQALLLRESDSWTQPDQFLISKYAISYTYFCKMLLAPRNASDNDNRLISFGLEFDDYTLEHLQKMSKDSIQNKVIHEYLRSSSFSKLPFSDDEAREIAELMNGQSWLNEQATKATFLQQTPEANIIHMASHSILNEEQPEQSALIFVKTRDSLDNLLRLEEIYTLRLNAALIVLSACNTGLGRNYNGEGMNSLARAFNFSGIPSVTATFWNISDESSKKIMELYYQFLKAGEAKDVAMQQAQLEFLRNDEVSSPAFRIPVYWAAWMPIGDNSSISTAGSSSLWLSLLIIGICFLLIRQLFFRNKEGAV